MTTLIIILGMALILVPLIEVAAKAKVIHQELARLESDLATPKTYYELAELSARLLTLARFAKLPGHKQRVIKLLEKANQLMK